MTSQPSDEELRASLIRGRLRPNERPRDAILYAAVSEIIDMGSIYHVLTETPEQTSDIFRILIDDKVVVGFELERGRAAAQPTEALQWSVQQYKDAVGNRAANKLAIAIELAKQELAR